MRLINANCPCGYRSEQVRSGQHNYFWWIPVFRMADCKLIELAEKLPPNLEEEISDRNWAIYHATPREAKAARRKATAEMRRISDEITSAFIEKRRNELQLEFSSPKFEFDPPESMRLPCPACRRDTLQIQPVMVEAICRRDCGNEYPWTDSKMSGCPKCDHRPHQFRFVENDATSDSVLFFCLCSSSTSGNSLTQRQCPKCGTLAERYELDGTYYCAFHDKPLKTYRCPANFLFIDNDRRVPDSDAPNWKGWEDASPEAESVIGYYCEICESVFQRRSRSVQE